MTRHDNSSINTDVFTCIDLEMLTIERIYERWLSKVLQYTY